MRMPSGDGSRIARRLSLHERQRRHSGNQALQLAILGLRPRLSTGHSKSSCTHAAESTRSAMLPEPGRLQRTGRGGGEGSRQSLNLKTPRLAFRIAYYMYFPERERRCCREQVTQYLAPALLG
jgi:hypothetical protein